MAGEFQGALDAARSEAYRLGRTLDEGAFLAREQQDVEGMGHRQARSSIFYDPGRLSREPAAFIHPFLRDPTPQPAPQHQQPPQPQYQAPQYTPPTFNSASIVNEVRAEEVAKKGYESTLLSTTGAGLRRNRARTTDLEAETEDNLGLKSTKKKTLLGAGSSL